jgi:hypothetical protein
MVIPALTAAGFAFVVTIVLTTAHGDTDFDDAYEPSAGVVRHRRDIFAVLMALMLPAIMVSASNYFRRLERRSRLRSLLPDRALTKLYKQQMGREWETLAELEAWKQANVSGPVDPYEVLTYEEIERVLT